MSLNSRHFIERKALPKSGVDDSCNYLNIAADKVIFSLCAVCVSTVDSLLYSPGCVHMCRQVVWNLNSSACTQWIITHFLFWMVSSDTHAQFLLLFLEINVCCTRNFVISSSIWHRDKDTIFTALSIETFECLS